MTSPPPVAPLPPQPAPFYPAPPPPPRKPGTNGFAVAALIFGLLGLLPLSIIFGIVALVQIRRQPQAGKVIAIIGMVVPTVALVASIAAAIAVEFSKSDSTAAGNGQVSVDEIRIGDCLNGLTEGRSIENLPVVPCAEPHDGEVFASFPVSGAAFPGDAAVTSQAEKGCVERLRSYAPKAAEDQNTQLYYLHPTAASWLTGDREITCVALSATGKTTGSMFD